MKSIINEDFKYLIRFKTKKELDKLFKNYGFTVSHLFVYLNTSCNLRCKYCKTHLLDELINRRVLKYEVFCDRLNEFEDLPNNVTFLGGEPLIYKKLLFKCIDFIFEKTSKTFISVFTNGTLLDDEVIRYFLKHENLNLVISLDGKKEYNDKNRVGFIRKNSVYDVVLNKLLQYSIQDKVVINMVITPNNFLSLEENVFHFFKLGFKKINWDIDCHADWKDKDLLNLRKILKCFSKKYFNFKKKYFDFSIFNYDNLNNNNRQLSNDVFLTLMNDGYFYFCDNLVVVYKMKNGFVERVYYRYLDIFKKFSFKIRLNDFFCGFGFMLLENINKQQSVFKRIIKYYKVKNFFNECLK